VTDSESDSETDVFEIEVKLTQTALVAVKAESREEAWESLTPNQSREVQEMFLTKQFTGDLKEPVDVIATNAAGEIDLDLTE
jgi:hypothetical protein